jgi:hypothetical protein
MVELDDQEFTMIKDFIVNDLGDGVDWEAAPEEFRNKYTDILQIVNAYGAAEEQPASPPTEMAPG